jgi:cobalt-zinc-cadmium efflux system membrane fusion protein
LTSTRENVHLTSALADRQRVPLRLIILFLLGAGLLVFLTYLGFQRSAQEAKTSPPAASTEERVIVLSKAAQRNAGVAFETVQTRTRAMSFEAPGVLSLDETRTARIGSMVEGKIVSAVAQVGDRVVPGTVLAEIHSHVLHDAWADYRKAKAERTRRSTELRYAVQAEQRAQRLYADKAISLQEVQRAQVDRVAAQQALATANTELRRSEEALEHLGITALGQDPRGEAGEQIPVKSPLAGAVLEKNVTNGTAVTPGAQLFVVSDLSTLWALAEVDETRLPYIKVGLPVAIRVAAYPGETFPGTVIFIGDTLDPKTRRVTVRCRVPNQYGRLKPQMYATLAFGEAEARSVPVVPSQAVQELDGKSVVFTVDGAGKFSAREVATGPESEGWTEIRSGVQPGEKIVTTGSFLLKSELSKASMQEEE